MKKFLLLSVAVFLFGCSSTLHRGVDGTKFPSPIVETRPLQVSVIPGEKISGTARCRNFLFFTLNSPEKEAYGAVMQTSAGNFEEGLCTRGAVYNAISRAKADVLLGPQYAVSGTTFGCFFGHCLYSDSVVEVTGYKGTYAQIQDMPEDVIKERFKSTVGSAAQSNDLKFPF